MIWVGAGNAGWGEDWVAGEVRRRGGGILRRMRSREFSRQRLADAHGRGDTSDDQNLRMNFSSEGRKPGFEFSGTEVGLSGQKGQKLAKIGAEK